MPAKGQEYMQPAVFIAKLIGPTFVAIGVGILLNGQFYDAVMVEALHSPTLIYFYGLMALVPGLAVLAVYRATGSASLERS